MDSSSQEFHQLLNSSTDPIMPNDNRLHETTETYPLPEFKETFHSPPSDCSPSNPRTMITLQPLSPGNFELWDFIHPDAHRQEDIASFIANLLRPYGYTDRQIFDIICRLPNTGLGMRRLTLSDFEKLVPECGSLLYHEYHAMCKEAAFSRPPKPDKVDTSLLDDDPSMPEAFYGRYVYDPSDLFEDISDPDDSLTDDRNMPQVVHQIQAVDSGASATHSWSIQSPSQDSGCYSESNSECESAYFPTTSPSHSLKNENHSNFKKSNRNRHPKEEPSPPYKGGRGRPPKGVRGFHLWEFILQKLKEEEKCPRVIRWYDREEGIFKVLQSEWLAQMWGDKKNNSTMNYEKLSRALRYYAKRDVQKMKQIQGRKIFQFGPNVNWLGYYGSLEQ